LKSGKWNRGVNGNQFSKLDTNKHRILNRAAKRRRICDTRYPLLIFYDFKFLIRANPLNQCKSVSLWHPNF